MRQITMEEISYQKAVLRAALIKGILNQETYNNEMKALIESEHEIIKEEEIKAIKVNKLKNKLNLYVMS